MSFAQRFPSVWGLLTTLGLLLLLAAGNMLRSGSAEEAHRAPDVIVGLVKKVVHTSERYDGDRLFTRDIFGSD